MRTTIENIIKERMKNGDSIRLYTDDDYNEIADKLNIPKENISEEFIKSVHDINEQILNQMSSSASEKYYLNTSIGKKQMETFEYAYTSMD